MAEEDSFKVRKQHLLAIYFDLCSAKELENYLVKYQYMSALLTMDCTAILTCRFRFVVAYIDALVVIKLSDLFHGMVVVVVMKRHFLGLIVTQPEIKQTNKHEKLNGVSNFFH